MIVVQDRIKSLRKSKRIYQRDIAEKLNITVQAYSMKEKGKRPITTDELLTIAECLGVSASYFFERSINVKLKTTTA